MANNKVQLSNGTVIIDLTSDTVTSASHIKSGLVGHLADGTKATGTLIEKDVKSVTYNLTGGATASISTSEVVTGQGFSVKLNAPTGYVLSGVTITMGGNDITSQVFTPDEGGGEPNLQTKSVSYTPTTSAQSAQVTADSGYDGLEQVNVSVGAIPSEYIIPSGSQTVTENGTFDVSSLAEMVVNVASGGGSSVATGTVTPAAASTTISFDTGLSTITGILVMPINTPLTGSRTQAAMICLPSGSYYKAISIHTNSGGTGWVSPSVYTSNRFTQSGTTVTVTGAYSFRPAVGYVWYAW